MPSMGGWEWVILALIALLQQVHPELPARKES